MIKIAPSILSADFAKLGEQILCLERGGADMIHIDVMDGNFVPNISFGLPVIKSIRPVTNMFFDVHLMIEEPSKLIEEFVKAGADGITVHVEAERHLDRTIQLIKSLGAKAGVALNPATPVHIIKDLLHLLDMVLIMTVNPGFGGQQFIPYTKDKLKELKTLAEAKNPQMEIQVDGGIDDKTAEEVVSCGANILVAGSYVFKENKISENIAKLKRGISL